MITKQFIIQIKCYGDERAWRSVESHAVECSNDTLRNLKNAYLSQSRSSIIKPNAVSIRRYTVVSVLGVYILISPVLGDAQRRNVIA